MERREEERRATGHALHEAPIFNFFHKKNGRYMAMLVRAGIDISAGSRKAEDQAVGHRWLGLLLFGTALF